MKSRAITAAAMIGAYLATASVAQDTSQLYTASFNYNGEQLVISQTPQINGDAVAALYRLPENCGAICVVPHTAAEGVETVSERDVLAFMTEQVASGDGLLIDSRLPADRAVAFLPASINVPHSLITPDNPLLNDILVAMGTRSLSGSLNFTDALPIMVFDDGPTTTDAPAFIAAMLEAGYPAAKIKYYRGGMQVWTAMGLKTEGTQS
ncbi:rhodanese-like domain-containing protein [Yoonia sp. 208BN28-4]|uniref:rhodanese-like domain-containing protein n=1 Tax=Yoonia sp. 208BN28-4 TaxID=3126505 RepID=UPI0030A6730F